MRTARTIVAALVAGTLTGGCADVGLSFSLGGTSGELSASTSSGANEPGHGCADRVLAKLTLHQRVGQLFVSGVDSASPSRDELRVIRRHHIGGAILTGRSDAGVAATSRVSRRVRRAASGPVGPWVAVDQEGGYVQVLSGPGFASIPTALSQGQWRLGALREHARRWGGQLQRAGVNLDLAPVADTVPASLGTGNRPIGYYYREYGHRPRRVAKDARAVMRGLRAAGVQATAKHFPGLGRVRDNTDITADVTDTVTTRSDRYLRPFRTLINDGVPLVMVSSARYAKIDRRHLAAFSTTVIRGMLRRDLGFRGVVVSDDLGVAAAVAHLAPGVRAVRFLRAGGTVVLTVSAGVTPAMVHAVWQRAKTSHRFRRLIARDALRVLTAKRHAGLLRC